MPVTPFHLIPAVDVYFLFYRRLNGLAFFAVTVFIDVEPALYLIFNVPFPTVPLLFGGHAPRGFHMITHNPFSIVLFVAPAIVALVKFLELSKPILFRIFGSTEWVNYSWKQTYLSVLLGGFLHLGWDLTTHWDINLGFPFVDLHNPFVNDQAFSLILMFTLILILPSYVMGKKINRGSPFKKLP